MSNRRKILIRHKKGAIVRKLKQMEGSDVLLFEDETVLRLFPNMRRAWSMQGEQQSVAISGRNDQRVLFGTINVRTGHRVLLVQKDMRQTGFQALLRQVHRAYK